MVKEEKDTVRLVDGTVRGRPYQLTENELRMYCIFALNEMISECGTDPPWPGAHLSLTALYDCRQINVLLLWDRMLKD